MLEGQGMISLVGAGGKTSLMFKLAHEIFESGESVLTTTTTKIFMPRPQQSDCLIVSDSVESIMKKAGDFLAKKKLHVTAAAAYAHPENKLSGLRPQDIDIILKTALFRWVIVEADGAAGKPLKAPAGYEPIIPMSTKWLVGVVGLKSVGKALSGEWVHRPEHFSAISGLGAGKKITEETIGTVLTHKKGTFKDAPTNALRIAFLNQADVPGGLAAGRQIADLLIDKKKTGLKRVVIAQILRKPSVLEYHEINN